MGGRGPGGGGQGAAVSFESAPAGNSEFETNVLAVLDEMDKNQRSGNMNVPLEDGRLLRMLAQSINNNLESQESKFQATVVIFPELSLRTCMEKPTEKLHLHLQPRLSSEEWRSQHISSTTLP